MTSDPLPLVEEGLVLGLLEVLRTRQEYEEMIVLSEQTLASPELASSKDPATAAVMGTIASQGSFAALRLGRYQVALAFAGRELQIAETAPKDAVAMARALMNRALAEEGLGYLRKAASDYRDGLAVLDTIELGDSRTEALRGAILTNMAELEFTREPKGSNARALLVAAKGTEAAESKSIDPAVALNARGSALIYAGRPEAAVPVLEEARRLAEASGAQDVVGVVVSNLAMASWVLGKRDEAVSLGIESRDIHRATGSDLALANDCYGLGMFYRSMDRSAYAVEAFREAWTAVKTVAPRSVLALQILNELAVMRLWQGDTDRARAAAARGLETYEGMRADIGLTEAEQGTALGIYRSLVQTHVAISIHQGWVDEVVSLIERSKARFWYEAITRLELDPGTPNADATSDSLLQAAVSVQRQFRLLNWRGCLVLDFFVGPTCTYLAYGMDGRWSSHRIDVTEAKLAELVEAFRNELLRSASRRGRSTDAAQELSKLLFGRASTAFERATTIVLLPDGPLWAVPFDALPMPSGAEMVEVAPTFVTPSIPVLDAIRNRSGAPPAIKRWVLLALADPGGRTLTPIPGTRDQLDVMRVALGRARAGSFRTGNDASKAKVLPLMERATHVHIASHAFAGVDGAVPHIVLSDGVGGVSWLQPAEISRLKLDAELIFLSACGTSVGQASIGEGMMSLARAFLLAGARCAIGTLWPIVDRGAVELVRLFYDSLASGAPVASAMHQTRMELRRQGAPARLWAAPQVIGDAAGRGDLFSHTEVMEG
jgi:CHAT domain-containing protein/tetratricopeptide (TPR) repeat protein